ncbi:putative 2-aminoethylphosphonate ABC transporter permease subunit [Ectobacillus sp. JY-23]|uniref:putative 2-aminoethylphosphonate ABC transporter permease subunit n=1 Tax=Ectobacillus sp. JY-23 TaxID=2933872 RepID=UPI001FF29BD8|nr:putative 2-aminoethylphosphonate ABC transporter permease subunit [Ectobacillus sp. JY-23]UOY91901.1 putative 2-aminoethylphosphonate ABC transporter permease subunit [Ectobacillus sp. JY-23]
MEMISKHVTVTSGNKVKKIAGKNEWLQRLLILIMILSFLIVLILPLLQLFMQAFFGENGKFIGLQNFRTYFTTPSLVQSLQNSLFVSAMTTVVAVTLAFCYAYALVRTNIRGKILFRYAALLPLFAPTMMYGIALMYLFGNQGLITHGLFRMVPGWQIDFYGPIGIIMAEVIYTFPQAFLILLVALQGTDYRLYEAADTLGAGIIKKMATITLPSVKYGLMSAIFVVFTLSFTDFGAPKVVGGQYNVLATDIYKQVIGQQNMSMGATVGILLLLPAILAFAIDRIAQRKQAEFLSSKAVPYMTKENRLRDYIYFVYCSTITGALLLVVGAVFMAAVVKVWPYNMNFTLEHIHFSSYTGDGFAAYKNSLLVAAVTAVVGTVVTFVYAYAIEKIRSMNIWRRAGYLLSVVPLAVPGLVIGLGYIFFFSNPEINLFGMRISNPFHFLYGTVAILVLANVIHFYSVAFVTATTALKKLDREFELVSESMGVPFYKTLWKITIPMCLPAILEMMMYFFVNAMVTISAVVFLYSADFKLAAVSIVNMEDAGNLAPAAAMSMLILITNIIVRVVYERGTKALQQRTLQWQKR